MVKPDYRTPKQAHSGHGQVTEGGIEMVKPSYRTPKQAHQSRRDLPPGGKEYFAQLIKAKSEPEKHGMPICYRHIEDLAQSISRRGVTESVLVLVEPGLADPNQVSPNMFCCFLCQRDGA